MGTAFYLGDENRAFFGGRGWAVGGYLRYNWNPHFATKADIDLIDISRPIDNTIVNADVQQEFNFFPFGQMNSHVWSRFFTPYISAGVGLASFNDERESILFAFNVPFGLGVKVKFLNRFNLGLQWTLHKLFTDKLDGISNPYQYKDRSDWMGKDWYSQATLSLGVDIGSKKAFCKE